MIIVVIIKFSVTRMNLWLNLMNFQRAGGSRHNNKKIDFNKSEKISLYKI